MWQQSRVELIHHQSTFSLRLDVQRACRRMDHGGFSMCVQRGCGRIPWPSRGMSHASKHRAWMMPAPVCVTTPAISMLYHRAPLRMT